MADENCLATGNKRWASSFGVLGGDGAIEIREESNQLVGTHEPTKQPLKDIKCDGNKISFSRVDRALNVEIFYEDGKFTPSVDKIKIKGKFRVVHLAFDSESSGIGESNETQSDAVNGGDWEAEKPVA